MSNHLPPAEEARRDIPDPTKRELRQEAGFGCCICGFPFLEYHHIVSFAEVRRHDPQHMMLLCPNHHRQTTAGALTEEEQRRWKSAPFNLARGNAQGQLFLPTPVLVVRGREWAIVGPFVFAVADEVILQIRLDDQRRMLITLKLYDRNDNLLFSVVDNEWITGDPIPWDFESNYRWLRMRRGHREATIRIDATREHVRLDAILWRRGYRLELADGYIDLHAPDGRSIIEDIRVIVGLRLLVNPTRLEGPLLPGGAYMMGGPDLEEVIAEAIQLYEDASLGRIPHS